MAAAGLSIGSLGIPAVATPAPNADPGVSRCPGCEARCGLSPPSCGVSSRSRIARAAADRIAGRRTWLVGTGTSWHAAHHGAWLLREANADAVALRAADVALYGHRFDAADAVIVLIVLC